MSDNIDRARRLKHLPLFPLPLVMLPGEVLPLHIFEDRYRQMLRDVETAGTFFGILLFEPDAAFAEKPPAGSVGCVAEVRESELLPDGRSNIVTQGLVRFRLIDYVQTSDPYLVGNLEFFDDEPGDPAELGPLADEVFALFERMAKAAFKMSGQRGRIPEIPRTDPESLSFLITAAFIFDNAKKYALLQSTSTSERLQELRSILQPAVGQMEESADIQRAAQTNGHSKKKIKL